MWYIFIHNKFLIINKLWNRRHSTKTNGVSYIVQRAAEAVYSEEGQKQITENIEYYMNNARIIRQGLEEVGYTVFGEILVKVKEKTGINSHNF